ncbi:MAG: TM1812 family CRISPR-associated protein, partial [Anaerolineae bacterium]
FLTFLAAAYLRVARHARIRAVVYGAYEALPKGDPRPRPVFDLTPFVSLLDWLAATNQFIRTGDAQDLARLLRREGETRKSSALRHAGEALESFSLAVMLCRPLEVMEKAGQMENRLKKAADDMAQWARPFVVMADRIQAEYGRYSLPKPTENVVASLKHQLALIQWYAKHGQIIQAVTLAREWLITAIGWRLGRGFVLSVSERENIERGIAGLSRERWDGQSEALNEVGKAMKEWPDEEREILRDLWDHLSNARNDLDHAGMNPSPMSVTTLRRKTEEILPKLKDLARRWELEEGEL